MEKEVLEIATKAKEAKEVEKAEVEVEFIEDTVNMELLINTMDYVVLYESIYLTTVKRYHRIKRGLCGRS